jgi:hypothetical protein
LAVTRPSGAGRSGWPPWFEWTGVDDIFDVVEELHVGGKPVTSG